MPPWSPLPTTPSTSPIKANTKKLLSVACSLVLLTTSNQGASTINAIEAAREANMIVAAVVCIVEREEANGRPAVAAAANGAPFLRLFTAVEVRAEHIKHLEESKL